MFSSFLQAPGWRIAILASPKEKWKQTIVAIADYELKLMKGADTLLRHLVKPVYKALFYSPHWRVGWRLVVDAGALERGDLDGPPWNILQNPPYRFFADPFPIIWKGSAYMFFEDFDHRIGKGAISAVEISQDGEAGEVFRALEEPWHLSYPFLMQQDDQIWMVPESSQSNAVSLYRATCFPTRWIKEKDLLENIRASDATLIRHQGLFWMFATVDTARGTSFDALHLFWSRSLLGPWTPHRGNPVVIDATCARPAGAVVVRDGIIWRPAQDCGSAYGAAISLAEVTRLNPNEFTQIVRARLTPGGNWSGRKLHTLNRAGPLECIDGSAMALRRII